jgi:hypothetical protein
LWPLLLFLSARPNVRLIVLVVLSESGVAGDTQGQCDQAEKQQSSGDHTNILPEEDFDGQFLQEAVLQHDNGKGSLGQVPRRSDDGVGNDRPVFN